MHRTNLSIIGRLPKNSKLFGFVREQKLKRDKDRRPLERLVKKAIYMECSPELANRAIHGYRRSQGGDEIAEEDFKKTDQPEFHVKRDYHYRKALRVCEKLFRPSRRLKPIAFPDLRYFPWTLNVSAEAPFAESKYWQKHVRQKQAEGLIDDGRMTFHNLYNEIFEQNRTHIHTIKFGLSPFWDQSTGVPIPYKWTTLHARSHTVKAEKDDKIRAVFGVPKLLLMAENMFIWNLQKEYLNKRVEAPMLWGFETFKGGWNKLHRAVTKLCPKTVISADWSGFDHRALHEVIDDVHLMWRSWFDFDGYEPSISDKNDYSHSTVPEWKIQNLWDWMTDAVKHTKILGVSGTFYQWKFNGIASGFQQTQLLDSFVNAVYLLTCLSAAGMNIEADGFKFWVQGDDSLTVSREPFFQTEGKKFIEKLAHEALTRFNAVLSPEKTSYGENLSDVEVLSYKNRFGIAYRDSAELLAKLLYPERPRTLGATASAAIGIAQAAMGCSTEVYNTCRNVFEFITKELGITPTIDPNTKTYAMTTQGVRTALESLSTGQFPSFNETFAQNFDLSERSETEKERLWPTRPTGEGLRSGRRGSG
nr:RNA-dependent RNA polymerase [Sarcosphaera coronaria partitivirus]